MLVGKTHPRYVTTRTSVTSGASPSRSTERRPTAPSPRAPGRVGDRAVFVAATLAIVSAFAVRLTGVVEPLAPDQGIFATAAWGLQRGLTLYRDLWDQKPPGIHLTYLLGFTLFGDRAAAVFWIDFAAAALTALILFDLGRRAMGPRFGSLVALVFAVGTMPAARGRFGGFQLRAVPETFICLLAAAAAWAAFNAVAKRSPRWSFGVGLFLGAATVFKPHALVYWLAFVAWPWFVTDRRLAWRLARVSLGGLVVAPLLTVGWLWSAGAIGECWVAVVEYNLAYVAGGTGALEIAHRFAHEVWLRIKTDEVWLVGSAGALLAMCAWRGRRGVDADLPSLGVFWMGAALLVAASNGVRVFITYFIPSLAPLCLLAAWLLWRTLGSSQWWRRGAGLAALAGAAAMVVHSGSAQHVWRATITDVQYLMGVTDRETYLGTFQSQHYSALDASRLAEYVRTHTSPDETIYIFGMAPDVYLASGRLPANRFLWVYPAVAGLVARPEFGVDALARDLLRAGPRYLILQHHNSDSLSGWHVEQTFASKPILDLLTRYRQEAEIGFFVLYRRE